MKMKTKILLISAALIMGITAVACSDESSDLDDYYDYYSKAAIESIKTGTNNIYNYTTYGEAFDNFFTRTNWTYLDGRIIGSENDIVTFTGDCTYEGEEVEATIDFTLYDDGTFTATSLSFNDVDQSNEVLAHLLAAAFTSVLDSQDQELSDSSAQNSSDTGSQYYDDYKSAYTDYISTDEYYNGWFTHKYYYLYDMDNDSSPELIVNVFSEDLSDDYRKGLIFTYKNGQMTQVYENDTGFSVYEANNELLFENKSFFDTNLYRLNLSGTSIVSKDIVFELNDDWSNYDEYSLYTDNMLMFNSDADLSPINNY